MDAPRSPARPGLAKTRAAPLVRRRVVELTAASDGGVRDLFEAADVVSEGGAREEGDRLVYYGSTSLLLVPADPALLADLARVLPLDPHTRARALRVAHREASTRAGGALDTVHAEISFVGPRGGARPAIAVMVDVTAVVLRRRARSQQG
ncbi:MAG TPA: hypothetical protein VLS89_08500 [Candidatus Nanopelagicales bacterium]|nr:hypothetical protein [Candidatus Nanopelagicales bacterium]